MQENNPSRPLRAAPRDGAWGPVALAALLALTASVLLTFGATTLAVSKAATREESAAAATVFAMHPYMMALGALSALVLLAVAARLAVPAVAARAWGQAAVLLLAGAAVVAAAYTLAWGLLAGHTVETLPVAYKLEGSVGASFQPRWLADLCDLCGYNLDGRVGFTPYGLLSLGGLLLAAVLWIGRAWWLQTRRLAAGDGAAAERGLTDCIRRATPRQILAALPGACLSALGVSLAFCLPISFLALLRMSAPLDEMLPPLGLTICCVAVLGLLLCVGLQLFRALWIGLLRAGNTNGKTVALIGLLAGLCLFLLVRLSLTLSFGGELKNLGMTLLFDTFLLIGGLLYGLGVSRNLLALSAGNAPADAGQLVRLCVLSGALLPVLPVLRRLRRSDRLSRSLVAAGCLVLAAVAVALALPFFQKLDDHFTRINQTLALLIVVLTVLLGQAIAPPSARAWRAKLALLAVLAAPGLAVVAASPFAMRHAGAEMNIHSPLGKASSALLSPLLPAPPRALGTSAVPLAASAPGRDTTMDALKAKRPLIVLVLWDACRPDHMSLYGYKRDRKPLVPTTPNLDAHKDELLRFTNCFTHGTGTSCSMRQFLTARYSSRWMLRNKGIDPFWLNELANNGYDAFFLNIIGSDYNGISLDAFSRDMPAKLKARLSPLACNDCPASARESLKEKEKNIRDYADLPRANPDRLGALGPERLKLIECNRQNEFRCTEDLLKFLATRKDTKGAGVFAYLHPDATHSPWQRFEEVRQDFPRDEKNTYDQCVLYSDYVTGNLINGLKKLGMWDDTIFIMMADHGTGLMDHGVYGGFHPWLEQIHVPLVLKIPGVKGRQIDQMVGLMDLGPTLVNIFQDPLPSWEGRSLWPVITGRETWPDRVMFGLNAFNDCYYMVTADGWQYIRHRGNKYEQLFNWHNDRANKHNLMGADREHTIEAQERMNWFLEVYGRDRNYNDPDHYEAPPGEE